MSRPRHFLLSRRFAMAHSKSVRSAEANQETTPPSGTAAREKRQEDVAQEGRRPAADPRPPQYLGPGLVDERDDAAGVTTPFPRSDARWIGSMRTTERRNGNAVIPDETVSNTTAKLPSPARRRRPRWPATVIRACPGRSPAIVSVDIG